MKEAGMDTTRINQLTKEKKEWKSLVNQRVRHLEEWEKKAGHIAEGERGERNVRPDNNDLTMMLRDVGKFVQAKQV